MLQIVICFIRSFSSWYCLLIHVIPVIFINVISMSLIPLTLVILMHFIPVIFRCVGSSLGPRTA